MMVAPLKAGKLQQGGVQPLPPGLHVSPIFLKKGVQVVHVVSVSPVPPVELSPEMEAALGTETAGTHVHNHVPGKT